MIWTKFLETYNLLPRLNHEKVENLNRPVTSKETQSVIKNLPNKNSRPSGFTIEFYQILRKIKHQSPQTLSKKLKRRKYLLIHSMRPSITLIPKQTKTLPEKYRSISHINIDVKILNKIPTDLIQQYFIRTYTPKRTIIFS